MKKLISLLLPLIGLAIFAWILRGIGIQNLLNTLAAVDRRRLLAVPPLLLYLIFIRGLRWRHLMGIIDIHFPLHRALLIWSVGFAAGAITPGKVGDAVRAFYLSKDTGRNLGESFLTVFVDRLLDLTTVLCAGAIALLAFSYYYTNLPNLGVIIVAVVTIVSVLYVALNGRLMKKFLRPAFNLIAPERYKKELSGHFNSFYEPLGRYVADWKRTSIAVVYTLLFWCGVILLAYTVAWAMNLNVTFRFMVLVMPMLTLVEVLPISIGGLGTRDAAAIYLFSFVGIRGAEAVGFSLMYALTGTYLVATVGFVAWLFKPAEFKKGAHDT